MIKLHLFGGFENTTLGITPDMELGHLYDDAEQLMELVRAGKRVGMKERWIQTNKTGIWHFDLWGKPLEKAKAIFPIVDDIEFVVDIERVKEIPRCGNCRWWEFLEEDIVVGHHGACHHPIGEAQHIGYMGKSAPHGLAMEGVCKACRLWERKGG